MNYEVLSALALFAFVSSITPGPNNLMLMTSSANFGVRSTLPHLLGVVMGFAVMIILVGIGVMEIFDRYPVSYEVLKICSVAYLLYLAVKMAMSKPSTQTSKKESQPMSFIQASAFQWVNPKSWTMALTAVSVYAPSNQLLTLVLVSCLFGMVNLPCVGSWVLLGDKINRYLSNHRRLKLFNYSMSALLVTSIYPAL